MQCVILAGGLGSRMRPITEVIPKAMIPVHGRPFVEYQLELLSAQGISDVVFCVGYLGNQIRDRVGDGRHWNLNVTYADEGPQLKGTAGALRVAFDSNLLAERFFVLYGDSYLTVSMQAVSKAFHASDSPALMTVFANANRWETNNVIFRNGKIELYDKQRPNPRSEEMEFVDYGLSALRRNLIETQLKTGETADLSLMFHKLSVEGLLDGYEVTERFYEVGSAAGLADFENFAMTALPKPIQTK